MELSPTMKECLEALKRSERLVRFPGGFWCAFGAKLDANGIPIESYGTNTIHALVTRGEAIYSEYQENARGKFAVAVSLPEINV